MISAMTGEAGDELARLSRACPRVQVQVRPSPATLGQVVAVVCGTCGQSATFDLVEGGSLCSFVDRVIREHGHVVQLAVAQPAEKIQADIVRDLERLLERARAGELESLAWFAESSVSTGVEWGCSGTTSQVRTIGHLEVVKHSLLNSFTEVEEGTRRGE